MIHDVGRRPRAVAEFSISGMGQDTKLLDGIHGGFHDEAAIDVVEIVCSVDEEVVGFRPLPIYGVGLTVTEGAACLRESGRDGHDARL